MAQNWQNDERTKISCFYRCMLAKAANHVLGIKDGKTHPAQIQIPSH
jgi:hypothetical protein